MLYFYVVYLSLVLNKPIIINVIVVNVLLQRRYGLDSWSCFEKASDKSWSGFALVLNNLPNSKAWHNRTIAARGTLWAIIFERIWEESFREWKIWAHVVWTLKKWERSPPPVKCQDSGPLWQEGRKPPFCPATQHRHRYSYTFRTKIWAGYAGHYS